MLLYVLPVHADKFQTDETQQNQFAGSLQMTESISKY